MLDENFNLKICMTVRARFGPADGGMLVTGIPYLWIYTMFLILLLIRLPTFTMAIPPPVDNKFNFFKYSKTSITAETRALRCDSPSGHICRRFSLAEILCATRNFDDKCLIGKGGSAKVYKGILDNGGGSAKVYKGILDNGATTVAIKRLSFTSKQAGQSVFQTEIELLSKFRHSHLVSLVGYCDEWHEMILVFEYIPYGTLSDHLHRNFEKGYYTLSWIQRLRICIGAAQGLDYLHTGTSIHQRVIHRDVKSTNILLDDSLEAKIADFGISKIVAANQGYTYVSTAVRGTFGYMDPAYFMTGRLTRKSDVYALGVVLFEVLSGRRAVDLSRDDEQSSLAGWVQKCIKEGKIYEIIDSNLNNQISQSSLLAFVKIAHQCLNSQPTYRPTMAEIVVVLEFALALQESPDHCKGVKGTIADNGAKNSTAVEIVYGADQVKPFKMNHKRITFPSKVCQIVSATIRALSVDSNAKDTSYRRNKSSRIDKKIRLNQLSNFPEANNRIRLNKIGIFPGTNKRMRLNKIPEAKGLMVTANLRMFTLAELGSATRGFSPDMMLGEGNYGRVFIGWLDEYTFAPSRIGVGLAVAIKRFDSNEGFKAVQTEVDLCGRFYHPNLVKLLGFCSEAQEFLLVYEYTPKGNLERYTYKDNGKSLSWAVWLKILIGAARYLAFLHSSEDHIVFGDFRPSNILLDGDFNAKIYDSGRAICGPDDGDTVVTGSPYIYAQYCEGSEGYLSPEYKEAGHLSSKNDVYAFGVVLLEILTGVRVISINGRNKNNLVDKARPVLACESKFRTVVNPRLLEQKYCPKGVQSILSDIPALALKCLDLDPDKRPSMRQVVEVLEDVNAILK
ncbi:uncharacterized protein LOC141680372 [Apium graveolens]|uniref:uncharacterized protein LOC141680372 n=1 Tax=Apium graveolens TaxID=4045 RepID=UPI003D7A55F0